MPALIAACVCVCVCACFFITSYLQIYNGKIFDLLAHAADDGRALNLHMNHDDGAVVEGLSKHELTTLEEALRWFDYGEGRRHVRATQSNLASSRSHVILQLRVLALDDGGGACVRCGVCGVCVRACARAVLYCVSTAGSTSTVRACVRARVVVVCGVSPVRLLRCESTCVVKHSPENSLARAAPQSLRFARSSAR